jgi:hypothetical protein
MTRPIQCPHCERRLVDQNGLWMHVKTKHKGKPHSHLRPERTSEPSMAQTLIDAQIAAAMGVEPPEWLESMFPEAFEDRP